VADDAANYRATHHADTAVAGQDSPARSADAGADHGTPPKPNSRITAAAFTANLCIVFIWNTSLLNVRCRGNSCPADYLS
jgi:hypothetical protein